MLRGLLTGTILGTAVSGLALVAASPFVPRVEIGAITPPAAGELAVPAGSEFNAELPDEPPALPATEGRPAGETPSLAGAEGVIASPEVDTSSVAAPDTVTVEGAIAAPVAGDGLAVTPSSETAVATGVGVGQPVQPGLETAPETEVAVGETSPEVPSADVDPGGIAAPSLTIDSPNLPGVEDSDPFLPSLATISPDGEAEGLPNIGGGTVAPPAAESDEPALAQFAQAYEAVADVPMISIVLLDKGDLTAEELAGFPIPLTVVIDPLADDALARMSILRGSGIEVLVLTPLAEGSSPADVEVAFQSFLNAVPEAVGVMDLPSAVLQESRPRASQVIDILKATGHGLLTYNKGLNTALQIAEQEKLAAAKVTRVFDEGGDGPAMSRALDQGAFQSSRDGSAVLVGTLRSETLAVLTQWFTGNRAASVQMVPVSVILAGK